MDSYSGFECTSTNYLYTHNYHESNYKNFDSKNLKCQVFSEQSKHKNIRKNSDTYSYNESSDNESAYESDQENRTEIYNIYNQSYSCINRYTHKGLYQRKIANMRERKRMQNINDAFQDLRSHIPTLPHEKRLSKVDTLKYAISYIKFLNNLVSINKFDGSISMNEENRQYYTRNETTKIIVRERGQSLLGYSLSWTRRSDILSSKTRFAKVWMPEDPHLLQDITE